MSEDKDWMEPHHSCGRSRELEAELAQQERATERAQEQALDIQAELAQVRAERDRARVGERKQRERFDALTSPRDVAKVQALEAELAQVREERDHNARTAVELDRQLVQVREERDAATKVAAVYMVELVRYREALERIAAMNNAWDEDGNLDVDEAPDIARAALTGETTDA